MSSDSNNTNEIFSATRMALKGRKYLIAVPIPFFKSDDDSIWIDTLWYKDLIAHLQYIDELRVLAPCKRYEGQLGLKRIDSAEIGQLDFVPLPAPESVGHSILSLPATIACVTKAVWGSDIIHSGMAGWPIPIGAIVNPIAFFCRKPLVIVVESAFWRVTDDEAASFKRKVRASLTEAFARWSVRIAKLAVFTHSAYKDSLAQHSRAEILVSPACWVLDEDILPEESAKNVWKDKLTQDPKFLIAARLTRDKGIALMMDALEVLENQKDAIRLDLIGQGELCEHCQRMADSLETVNLKMLDPVEHGPAFFSVLQNYHAVIVPSISDEQPRIIFDAFSQAVPVIASDTSGHVEVVEDNQTGWLFKAGDRTALCSVLQKAASNSVALHDMGQTALHRSREYTHRNMHLKRAQALMRTL